MRITPTRPTPARASALLLAACTGLLAACSDTSPTAPAVSPAPTTPTAPAPPTTPAPTPPAPPANTVVPAEVAGEWTFGSPQRHVVQRMRTEFFQGRPYHYIGMQRARLGLMTLHPDGRYSQLFYYYLATGMCQYESWKEMHGTAAFMGAAPRGGPVVVAPTRGRWRYRDHCDERRSYDRAMTAEELAAEHPESLWKLGVGANDGRTFLAIGKDDGRGLDDPWMYYGWDWWHRPE